MHLYVLSDGADQCKVGIAGDVALRKRSIERAVKLPLALEFSAPLGAGEIETAMKAIGVPVRYADEAAARSEKGMTHADWIGYLEMYQPSVVLVETILR